MTHEDVSKAVAEWKANQRINGGTYEWVKDRHVLAACTPAEIPLLLDVMAACYFRLSDECLYAVQMLQEVVKRVDRGRYRARVWICESIELAKGKPK